MVFFKIVILSADQNIAQQRYYCGTHYGRAVNVHLMPFFHLILFLFNY